MMAAVRAGGSGRAAIALLVVAFLAIIASNEHMAEAVTCNPTTQFKCVYLDTCIDISKQYNGVNDCYDNTDEMSSTCVKTDQFICKKMGSCLPISYRWDGDKDCSDGSDEGKIIGDHCNTTWCCPCEMFIPNAFCDTTPNTCQCNTGYYPSTLKNSCIARIIGDSCSVTTDCSAIIPNSDCTSGSCSCNDGYYETDNNTVCTARVLGDSCVKDTDCSGAMRGSVCQNGACACHPDWFDYANGTACWHLLLGDNCTRDSLCSADIPNAYCKDGFCNCTAGWIWKEGTFDVCRIRILGVDYCETTADCGVANSKCESGVCMCETMYRSANGNTSCTLRLLNDACTGDSSCAGVSNAKCSTTSSLCTCESGYKSNVALDTCSKLQVNDPCTSSVDCANAFTGGYCSTSNLCACIDGYVTTTANVCRPRSIGVDACTTDLNCYGGVPNSSCVAGKCRCNAGYSASPTSNTSCVVVVVVDLSTTVCAVDTDCSLVFAGSVCVSGLCGCPAGYITSTLNCTLRTLGGSCSNSTDCAGVSNSACDVTSGVCQCQVGYIQGGTTTCRRRVLGSDPCTMDSDCTPGITNSLCAPNNTCLCGPGYETTPDNMFCLDSGASTDECTDFASCKPWAIALIIVALLLPPIITGVVMLTYKNIQERKSRLLKSNREKYGRPDPYRDFGMAAIPTITNFTAPHDTALHTLPEIGADWSLENDDTYFTSTPKGAAGLVIRDKSFFRDITSIKSKGGSQDELMSKVDI